MDLKDLEKILSEMVEESTYLPADQKELIPGTDISVKKGRTEEFKAYARLYVEVANNVKVTNDMDYVSIAFNQVKKEIEAEKDAFYTLNAQNLYAANHDKIEKFNKDNVTLKTITKNHAELLAKFDSLQRSMQTTALTSEQLEQFNEISSDIKDFANGIRHLRETITATKNEINANFLSSANEELNNIRSYYAKNAYTSLVDFGTDGKSVLAGDKLEYDSILKLIEITKRVNEDEPMVTINDTLCVNESQKEEVEKLLANSRLFSKLITPEYTPTSLNTKLIAEIQEQIEQLEQYEVKPQIYNDLVELRNILVAANNDYIPKDKRTQFNKAYSESYVGVWGVAFVPATSKDRVDELLRKTGLLKEKDPNTKKQTENAQLIEALEKYKTVLEDLTPSGEDFNALTSIANDKKTVVKDENLEEFNAVLKAIEILRNAENQNDLRDVWGVGYVRTEDILSFKNCITKIKLLNKKVPGLIENDIAIAKINEELTSLNELARVRVKENPNAILAPNGVVLHEDLPVYNALVERLKYLELSKGGQNLAPVDGALISKSYINKYNAAIEQEKVARENKPQENGITPPGTSGTGITPPAGGGSNSGSNPNPITFDNNILNAAIKQEISEKTQKLYNKAEGVPAKYLSHLGVLNVDEASLTELLIIADCLKNADKADAADLIEINGVKIHKDDEEKYKTAVDNLSKISETPTYNDIRLEEIEGQIGILLSSAIGVPVGTAIHEACSIDGTKVLNIDKDKYNALANIQTILGKYKNGNLEDFIKVDGLYIHKDDEQAYNDALNTLNNLETSLTQNDKLLKETIENIYKLVSDSASSLDTNVVTIDGFTVLSASEPHLRALLDIKDCLEKAMNADESKLTDINGIKIHVDDEEKYNKAVKIIHDIKNPRSKANDDQIKEIDKLIEILVNNAQNLDAANVITIKGYTVSVDDQDKLEALLDMREILENGSIAPDSECKVMNDGFKIKISEEQRYLETLEKLNNLTDDRAANKKKEAEVQESIQKLVEKAKDADDKKTKTIKGYRVLKSDEKELNKLLDIQECLENAKTSDNLVKQKDGIMIDKGDIKAYKQASKPPRQKITIRRLGSMAKETIKKHWKATIALGLAASALAVTALAAPGVLAAIPAALQGVALANIGATLNGIAISGVSILGTLAATKGREKTKEFASNVIQGRPYITANDLAIAKIEYDSSREYPGNVTEEELDALEGLSPEEQIEKELANIDVAKKAEEDKIQTELDRINAIQKMIDERVKNINEEREKKAQEKGKKSTLKYPDAYISVGEISSEPLPEDTIKAPEKPVVVTIPSNDEIIRNISDKNLIMAQVDNYVDEILNNGDGKIYSTPILKTTGIDLFAYDVTKPEEVNRAKNDIGEALKMFDVSYILGEANTYFYAEEKGLESASHRDIVKAATGIDLDEYEINKKNQEYLRKDIENAMKKKHYDLMSNIIYAQADNYRIANMGGQNAEPYRDAVFATTGVDLDEYDLSTSSGMNQANTDITHTLNYNNFALSEMLSYKVDYLQSLIDDEKSSPEQIAKAERDKQALLTRIDSLKENRERGI